MTATTAIPDDVPSSYSEHAHAHEGNAGRQHTDWLGNELRQDVLFVVLRNRSNNGCKRRDIGKLVFPRKLVAQRIEVEILWRVLGVSDSFMVFDEGVGDICAAS